MVDIVDTLIQILCQQGTQSDCTQFLSSYPDIAQQLVFFVLFPAIFLIIFVNIIAKGVTAATYKTLLAIGIFIFIIYQGWYHFFLNISKFWFIGLIVLGGIYVLIRKMGAASGNGGGGGGKGAGRSSSSLTKELLLGSHELNVYRRGAHLRGCKEVLRELQRKRKTQEDLLAKVKSERERSELIARIGDIDKEIVEVEEKIRLGLRCKER